MDLWRDLAGWTVFVQAVLLSLDKEMTCLSHGGVQMEGLCLEGHMHSKAQLPLLSLLSVSA